MPNHISLYFSQQACEKNGYAVAQVLDAEGNGKRVTYTAMFTSIDPVRLNPLHEKDLVWSGPETDYKFTASNNYQAQHATAQIQHRAFG